MKSHSPTRKFWLPSLRVPACLSYLLLAASMHSDFIRGTPAKKKTNRLLKIHLTVWKKMLGTWTSHLICLLMKILRLVFFTKKYFVHYTYIVYKRDSEMS